MTNYVTGKDRRTLKKIDHYPTPTELYQRCITNHWPYKSDQALTLQNRDNALVAVLYLAGLRVSEASRLTPDQFIQTKQGHRTKLTIIKMQLSKAERFNQKTGKVIVRKNLYRTTIPLPSKGPRVGFTGFLTNYLPLLTSETRLFNISTSRMDQIVKKKMGVPPHWLRAFCENYLYELWDNDLIAVANFMQVDASTLHKYIHRVPQKYLNRE